MSNRDPHAFSLFHDAFARWQREYLSSDKGSAAARFWQQYTAEISAPPELPLDHPRAPVRRSREAIHVFNLSPELERALQTVTRERQTSDHNLLLAALYVLLYRYTGACDLTIGHRFRGRMRREFEHIAGLFENTLPLRLVIDPQESFERLLARLERHLAEVAEHREYPVGLLLERTTMNAARHPFFDVVFRGLVGSDGESRDIGPAGQPCIPSPGSHEGAIALSLAISVANNSPAVAFCYDSELLEATTIARMAGHYSTLLAGLAADPACAVSALPVLTQEERDTLLSVWNDTRVDYPKHRLIHELFEDQAETTPDAVAVEFEGRELSYGAMNERVARLAHGLRGLGVGPDTLVGLYLERSDDMVLAIMGTLRAGGAYVPIDPDHPADRIRQVLDDAQPPVILTQSWLREQLPASATVLCLDRGEYGPAQALAESPRKPLRDSDLAYVIYTSGSTGRPKGVMNTHASIRNRIFWMQQAFQLEPRDRVLHKTPYSFDVSVWEFLWPLAFGARLVVARPEGHKDPRYLAEIIESRGITTMHFVPSMLRAFVDGADLAACGSLKRVICSGEALPAPLVKDFNARCGAQLHNLYGPTEAAIDVTWWPCPKGDFGDRVPIGKPIANVTTYVVDSELRPVPVGVPGELLLGGVQVARGYLNRPELTAEKFIADPFSGEPDARLYRTGDLVKWDEDGNIEFLGRLDHQVKIRGFRIELGDIENQLLHHPAIDEAVVLAREDRPGDKYLVAYVVAGRDRGAPSAEALREYLFELLPQYMVPSNVVFLDTMPLGPSGKVDRKALPMPVLGHGKKSAHGPGPETATQRELLAIWAEILGLAEEQIDLDDGFFELGGHSLRLAEVQSALHSRLGVDITMLALLRYTTIRSLARHVNESRSAPGNAASEVEAGANALVRSTKPAASGHIAIVGMAGRFPGCADIETLWRRLVDQEECLTRHSRQALEAAGVPADILDAPGFVPVSGHLEDADCFDAGLFGYSPAEARTMDPQHRLFLETAWRVLEQAGHDPERFAGTIGVFAGAGLPRYLLERVGPPGSAPGSAAEYQALLGNGPDFLATRAAFKLGLRGPAVNVYTACSTSLVAVHMACRSLMTHDCDMALAGGSAVFSPAAHGYLQESGMIWSPDGHCRPFDAGANGTVPGSGVALVALRRLEDAIADNDTIHAVILGSASNNDGSRKLGFTAPSVDGQVEAIRMAQAAAGVSPADIGYIEAHGTGTPLGDPIEAAALAEVFAAAQGRPEPFCALGSIKSNIGHLDIAAGVTGLIKAALCLEREAIPATLHFEKANPETRLERSPFFVNADTMPWPRGEKPRYAGVSALGLGGTNVHVVLGEAPRPAPGAPPVREWQLLPWSARDPSALDRLSHGMAEHLAESPGAQAADIAATLQSGRRHMRWRQAVVCRTPAEGAAAIRTQDPGFVCPPRQASGQTPPVAFLFPGGGTQYAGMGRELYLTEPVFRESMDACAAILKNKVDLDICSLLYPADADKERAQEALWSTALHMPAIVATEISLARLLESFGLRPDIMFGHSLGEFAAACVAGALSLEETLELVAIRGRLLTEITDGAMLAVPLPEAEVAARLSGELCIAVINGPTQCAVAGREPDIARLQATLEAEGVRVQRVRVATASHSPLVEPLLGRLDEFVASQSPRAPTIPYLSNVDGQPMDLERPMPGDYWARHLRGTARVDQAFRFLLAREDMLLLEVGPGKTLSTLLRRHPACASERLVTSLLPDREEPESAAVLRAIGRLWTAGVAVDWDALHGSRKRRRAPAPGYAFEKSRFLLPPLHTRTAGYGVVSPSPSLMQLAAPATPASYPAGSGVFRTPLNQHVYQRLARVWAEVLGCERVDPGDDFFRLGGTSLMAVQFTSLVRERLQVIMRIDDLLENPALGHLAAVLAPRCAPAPGAAPDAAITERESSLLVSLMRADSPRTPLFLVHPAGGTILGYRPLISALPSNHTIWGIRSSGTRPGEPLDRDIPTMAHRYLQAIRAVQPHGPYRIGGYSMGGLPAWELARALQEQGETVELLVLFDTSVPWADMHPKGIDTSGPPSTEQEMLVHFEAMSPNMMPALQTSDMDVSGFFQLFDAHARAMRAHKLEPYAGRLLFFRPTDWQDLLRQPTEGPWIDLARGGTEVHVVPGNHFSMMFDPGVRHIAATLGEALERLDRQ